MSSVDNWLLLVSLLLLVIIALLVRKRDFYVVVVEHRHLKPEEFGKGAKIENSYIRCFDDYLPARAFFDFMENLRMIPQYEDQQNINYIYAVPARSSSLAKLKVGGVRVHHTAKKVMETPYSVLREHKKYWDEERKARLS